MTTFSSKRSKLIAKLVRPLISAGLIFGGLFQMVSPVLALGTAAGVDITNTATATYEDPSGTVLDAQSNTVTVTVAEVAGITNIPVGITDDNSGSVNPNDTLSYDFLVTNTGNNETNINIPVQSISFPQGNLILVNYQFDLNNDGDFDDPGEDPRILNDADSNGVFDTGERFQFDANNRYLFTSSGVTIDFLV